MKVRPKKKLGQHFLADEDIAIQIVNELEAKSENVLEVGPGTGILTRHLLKNKKHNFSCIEIDNESVEYLHQKYPQLNVINQDFLNFDPNTIGNKVSIIGNFPYNISSQIFFSILNYKDTVDEVVCMLQLEVARRISSPPGNKNYGILSVLLKAWYDIDFIFTVNEDVFIPPPKVKSGVIKLKRNNVSDLGCNEKLFKKVVKTAFGQRRKTLRNSLKPYLSDVNGISDLLKLRPEQLKVSDFVFICTKIKEPVNN